MIDRKRNILGCALLFCAVVLPLLYLILEGYFDFSVIGFIIFCVIEVILILLTKKYTLLNKTVAGENIEDKDKPKPIKKCLILSIISSIMFVFWYICVNNLCCPFFVLVAPLVFLVSFGYSVVIFLYNTNDKRSYIPIIINIVTFLVAPVILNIIFPPTNIIGNFIEELEGILEMG